MPAPTDWLLIRGLGRTAEHWLDFPQHLASVLPPHAQLLLVDNPGIGTEHLRAAPLSVAATAADVLQRFHAQRPDPAAPWALLGLSLGGMVALEIAAASPAGLQAAVVINSSAPGLSPPHHRLTPGAMAAMLRSLPFSSANRERVMAPFTLNCAQRTAELLPRLVTLSATAQVPSGTVLRQMLAASRWRVPCREAVRVPLLFISSERDRLVSVRCSRALAQHFAAPLVTHPAAGHDLPSEAGAFVAATIRDWLQQHHLR